jgi:glutamyl/glutaminyl-tRNA synthetase
MRFKFSRTAITVHDLVCGDVTFAPTEEPDMTIRRPDGSYIFHFVNVVDDIEMRISHVIRGEDHLSNTWKHIDLFNAFGATAPTYAHIPLILNPDGTKMSKRDEGSAIEHSYMNAGFLPDAVFNYLCMLGWTPKLPRSTCTKCQLVQRAVSARPQPRSPLRRRSSVPRGERPPPSPIDAMAATAAVLQREGKSQPAR